MSSLISRLTTLKARLDRIPARLGSPLYRDLVFRMKEQITLPNGLITTNNTDILINPKVKVVTVQENEEDNMGRTIITSSNDYKAVIPRTINVPSLDNINYLILDPIFNTENKIIGGIKCSIAYISDKRTLDWEIIIQRVVDSYTIEPLNSVENRND